MNKSNNKNESINNLYRDKTKKINQDYLNEHNKSNYDHMLSKVMNDKELDSMINSLKENMDFYEKYKNKNKSNDKFNDIFESNIIQDDLKSLSTEEIKFLNEIESDIEEANDLENLLNSIENERSNFKKNIYIEYLNTEDEILKNEFSLYKKIEEEFYELLNEIDSTNIPFIFDVTKEQKRRNKIFSKIKKIANKLWNDAFFLFYSFGIIKLYKYFNNKMFNKEVVEYFKILISRNEWSIDAEKKYYSSKLIEKVEELDNNARELKYIEFFRSLTHHIFLTLINQYKDILYKESIQKCYKKENISNEEFIEKKNFLDKLFEILANQSYEENKNIFNDKEKNKYDSLDDVNKKNDYAFKVIHKKIYKLASYLTSHQTNYKIDDFDNESMIEVNNVTKIYMSKDLNVCPINNLNLKIKKGEFVVLLGASGSGKTTLMNMMSGIDSVTFGDMIVNGNNISIFNNKDLTTFRENNVGYIFQRYGLVPNITIGENVKLGAYLSNRINPTKNNRNYLMSEEELDDILLKLDLLEHKNKYPYQLSGGQQQRVSIARTIAKKPSVLFADEPTGALDETSTKIVIDLLKYINKKYNTTIVMITHDEKNTNYASREIHLKGGKIIKDIKKD